MPGINAPFLPINSADFIGGSASYAGLSKKLRLLVNQHIDEVLQASVVVWGQTSINRPKILAGNFSAKHPGLTFSRHFLWPKSYHNAFLTRQPPLIFA
jgi:hypothetical protein